MEKKNTSWEKSSKWYGNIVGEKGHYFHQNVVIPGVLKLLAIKEKDKVLDVACASYIDKI